MALASVLSRRSAMSSEKGQVMVEYLLLLSVTFLIAYLMISRGPLKDTTLNIVEDIRNGLSSLVRYGEFTAQPVEPPNPKYPGSPERLRPLHL